MNHFVTFSIANKSRKNIHIKLTYVTSHFCVSSSSFYYKALNDKVMKSHTLELISQFISRLYYMSSLVGVFAAHMLKERTHDKAQAKIKASNVTLHMSRDMSFPTMWHFDKCRLR